MHKFAKRLATIEVAAVFLAAIILFYILIIEPVIGVADNGDFYRMMKPAGLEYLSEEPYGKYFHYVNREYKMVESKISDYAYFSTGIILVKAARTVNTLLGQKKELFDIRFLSLLYICIFLISVYLLIKHGKKGNHLSDVLMTVLLIFVFTDIGYTAYFNSFYGEAVVFVFLLLALGAALSLTMQNKPKILSLAVFFISALFLSGAKAQYAPVGLLFALFSIRLIHLRKDLLWRRTNLVFALLLVAVSITTYISIPGEIKACNRYQTVFYGILKDSPHPEADLEELGLSPNLAFLAGTDYFMGQYPQNFNIKDPTFMNELREKINPVKVALFYLKHPGRYLKKLETTATNSFTLIHGYGNFEYQDSLKHGRYATSFNWWSSFKIKYLPHSLLFIALIYALYLSVLFIKHRLASDVRAKICLEFFMLLAVIGAVQFLIPILGDGEADLARHLFLFNPCLDMMMLSSTISLIQKLQDKYIKHSAMEKL
jgi:hypothetical protein